MKRNFIRLSAIAFSVACLLLLAVPALATGYDYTDYITDTQLDGENNLVTVSLPTDNCDWKLNTYPMVHTLYRSGNPANFKLDAYDQGYADDYQITCNALSGENLDITNIPNGTVMNFTFAIVSTNTTPSGFEDWVGVRLKVFYYDADGVSLRRDTYNVASDINDITNCEIDFPLNKPQGAVKAGFLISYEPIRMADNATYATITCNLTAIELKMSITELALLQAQTGKTNKILTEVKKQLEQQGKTLDDILNGTPEQNDSANNAAGILGDKGEQLGNLAGAIQPEKPNLDSVNTNVGALVPSSGVNTLTAVISPIANNELVIKILVMVATLILVSYVLFGKKG